MDSQAIALLIAAGGLVLGLARLAVSILSYRLDSSRHRKPGQHEHPDVKAKEPSTSARRG